MAEEPRPMYEAPPAASASLVGRALRIVGQTWTLLILREAINGATRFDEFQLRLGVSRPLLSQRLTLLVQEGLLERVPYREPNQRSRFEYRLTRKGHDLYPVMVALRQWGERYLLEDGEVDVLEHRGCGAAVHVRVICDAGHELAGSSEATFKGSAPRGHGPPRSAG